MYEITQADIDRADIITKTWCLKRPIPYQDFDDYLCVGREGLLDAAHKYQSDRNVLFSTYAKHRIKGALTDYYRKEIYIRHFHRGEPYTFEKKPQPLSFEDLRDQGIEPSADGLGERTANKELAHKLLNSLRERDRQILWLYYYMEFSQKQIAKMFSLTESRISQLIHKALKRIRNTTIAQDIKPLHQTLWLEHNSQVQ